MEKNLKLGGVLFPDQIANRKGSSHGQSQNSYYVIRGLKYLFT